MIIDTYPQVNVSQIWNYARPGYSILNPAGAFQVSLSTANTILSTGKGISLKNTTGQIYVRAVFSLLGTSTSDKVYLYRSTVGIPALGSPPNSGDVQLGSLAAPTSNTNEVMLFFDNPPQGLTVYYYWAALVAATTDSLQFGNNTALTTGIFGSYTYACVIEAIEI